MQENTCICIHSIHTSIASDKCMQILEEDRSKNQPSCAVLQINTKVLPSGTTETDKPTLNKVLTM